jgi:endonuclease/exonuclease/phosphatase family metal-dependent hydrolase
MTFNIRYDEPRDSLDNWHQRKYDLVNMVKSKKLTVLGIQEGLHHQVQFLQSSLPHFKYIGCGRDDGMEKGEFSAILVDTQKVHVVQSSTFWLSESPHLVSKGWDAALPRICTFALLRHKKNGRKFWVFNTHFDHVGVLARENSAKLILTQIEKLNTEANPVILMGDFNAVTEEKSIKILQAGLSDVQQNRKPLGPKGTFNGFGKEDNARRIDYIFISKFNAIKSAHISAKRKNGHYLSDHLPVMASLRF